MVFSATVQARLPGTVGSAGKSKVIGNAKPLLHVVSAALNHLVGAAEHLTGSADGRYGTATDRVTVVTSGPMPVAVPGAELKMLSVIGWVKVSPGFVTQPEPQLPPEPHPQLDMSTVTLWSRRGPGASWTRSPNSSMDLAWKA